MVLVLRRRDARHVLGAEHRIQQPLAHLGTDIFRKWIRQGGQRTVIARVGAVDDQGQQRGDIGTLERGAHDQDDAVAVDGGCDDFAGARNLEANLVGGAV